MEAITNGDMVFGERLDSFRSRLQSGTRVQNSVGSGFCLNPGQCKEHGLDWGCLEAIPMLQSLLPPSTRLDHAL